MGNKKGVKHYSKEFIEQIVAAREKGASICEISRKYGVSRWSIHCWCGLSEKVNQRQMMPQKRGRPTNKPEDLVKRVKRLEMENELLRNFLRELERK